MEEFKRIKRLPPYVFAIVNELKIKARARGEDIIDFGMGNPDLPTPAHIVEKLCEAARNPRNHQASARDLRLVPPASRCPAGPRRRGHRHHRREGGAVSPGPGRRGTR